MTTPTDGKMWTYSVWRKLGDVGAAYDILLTARPGASAGSMQIVNGVLRWYGNATSAYDVISSQTWRDPSAWYHFVFAYDTTQATASNRIKYYVNGVQGTFSSATYPTLNSVSGDFNAAHICQFGADVNNGRYSDGQYAEAHFIDGQALTPSSFGSTNALTGVWQPAQYTGTYGTNGFYLPFTDNSALTTSSNVGLGKDFSGNANYWVTNNISITAGVTYDSMTDVPTLTSATAANFAVLNPLANGGGTLAGGNLNMTGASAAWGTRLSTIAVSSGKWYAEITPTSGSSTQGVIFGISNFITPPSDFIGIASTSYGYYSADGSLKYNGLNTPSWGATVADNDVVGIALDLDAGTLKLYKNNVQQGSTITGVSGLFYIGVSCYGTATASANFGQRPFTYTAPTGFVALNTYNLPTSTILKGNTVMDATLYTGNGVARSIVNAAGFRPDFVWLKARNDVYSHYLLDSVRGATNTLNSNTTNAETTYANNLTAFNSNGFSLGTQNEINYNTNTYVGWQWQAGQGSSSSNTNGSITSTVSVNASAGFSVVTYTGTGANATVGHGLGVAPQLVITKGRDSVGGATNWTVYHVSIGNTGAVFLNLTNATNTSITQWNNTSPTSSVFSIGTSGDKNTNTATYVAYCWTPIAGYSAFGSYTGNGSTDGPFVYTGFRPKFVLIKDTVSASQWRIWDTARDPYNITTNALYANSSGTEQSADNYLDIVSNGFKIRSTNAGVNTSSGNYIYAAFAENPTKYALAR
jgi:hypothetical protein